MKTRLHHLRLRFALAALGLLAPVQVVCAVSGPQATLSAGDSIPAAFVAMAHRDAGGTTTTRR